MAEVTTSVIIAPTIAPFVTSNIRNVENSGIPFGALSHVHEFDVPAIGTGDVGRLIVYCRVPVNYLTVLNGFTLTSRLLVNLNGNRGFSKTITLAQILLPHKQPPR